MKKYTLILFIFLAVMTGCNALGIKESDNATENTVEENNAGGFLNDNQVSSGTQTDTQAEQIAQMQKEIDELVSTLNTKDMTITELENKTNELTKQIDELSREAANAKAAYDNLQGKVSVNNQYRNIAIIVALASILLNVILVYMLLKAKTKYSRAALPPAKKDESVLNDDAKKIEKTEEKDVKNNTSESDAKLNAEENNKPDKEQKRGRPKKADKVETTKNTETVENAETNTTENSETTTTAKRRGRPKKMQ